MWRLCLLSSSHVHLQCLGATRSIEIKPPEKYTVFQNDTPAIFYCYGNGFGTGAVVSWSLNGNGYGTQYAQMGITYVIDPPTGDTVSSRLIVPSNSTINNNTQVVCRAADVTFTNVLISQQTNLTIQGPLQFPSNFFVNISNTSNTTFLLSWDAPFSLDVTDSPDIYYYTLCTNITIYGCKNISSDPDCIFPRTCTCTSSVDFTGNSLNATSGGQNRTIMDYVDPIHFTFFAVNGAGNGSKANLTYFFKKDTNTDAPSHCHRAPNAILESSTQEKKRMYKNAIEDRRSTFTPFVPSVDGLLHNKASHFIKRMATALSSKWDKAYSITSSYIRSRLAFAGVRAVSLCLRGSRTKWRSGLGFDDGAPLAS
ncbi:hypothetical protein EMCRGX_G003179 [Ephydatia muelleri]